jgi:hypothetical protein
MFVRILLVASLVALGAGCASTADDGGTSDSALTAEGYVEPTEADSAAALQRYPNVDPTGVVPRDLLGPALAFLEINRDSIVNQRYLTVVDFSRHSGERRFFLIDMSTGRVEPHVVAHGSGSDPDNTGYATAFSNTDGSHMSSLGFYITAEEFNGEHGRSLLLDGVSLTNSNVRPREIIVHDADYVSESSRQQGRSWGCLVVDPSFKDSIVDRIETGSVIYAQVSRRSANSPNGMVRPVPDVGQGGGPRGTPQG